MYNLAYECKRWRELYGSSKNIFFTTNIYDGLKTIESPNFIIYSDMAIAYDLLNQTLPAFSYLDKAFLVKAPKIILKSRFQLV